MIDKGAEVRTRAQSADAQVSPGPGLGMLRGRAMQQKIRLLTLEDRDLRFRVFHIFGNAIHKRLQGMRPLHIQIATLIGVAVDINRGMLPQFVRVLLHPFRGTEQHGLLPIPGGVDDGALRLHPCLASSPSARASSSNTT